ECMGDDQSAQRVQVGQCLSLVQGEIPRCIDLEAIWCGLGMWGSQYEDKVGAVLVNRHPVPRGNESSEVSLHPSLLEALAVHGRVHRLAALHKTVRNRPLVLATALHRMD